MTHDCQLVDGVFLTQIARAVSVEIPQRTGEAAEGRRRLLAHLNSKIFALALPQVEEGGPKAGELSSSTLIAEAILDDRLCAHTRNFLQTALSRLERFDEPPRQGRPNSLTY